MSSTLVKKWALVDETFSVIGVPFLSYTDAAVAAQARANNETSQICYIAEMVAFASDHVIRF